MNRVLLAVALTALSAYAVACAAAFVFQRRLVYFPAPPGTTTPAARGLSFTDLTLATSDGVRLHAWLVQAPGSHGTVLVCHGNAGTIGDRLALAEAFVRMGWSCLLLDYRGYGRSGGSPSEQGTYRDAEAALEHLTREAGVAPERVVAYGESLGAAVAIELALRRRVAACVVESAFTSLPEIGARAYPWLPVRWLARIRYDNRAKVARLNVPLLLIHSPDDEVVPFTHAQALLAVAPDPKQLLATSGRHNDGGFVNREEHCAVVRAFLERALQGATAPAR